MGFWPHAGLLNINNAVNLRDFFYSLWSESKLESRLFDEKLLILTARFFLVLPDLNLKWSDKIFLALKESFWWLLINSLNAVDHLSDVGKLEWKGHQTVQFGQWKHMVKI